MKCSLIFNRGNKLILLFSLSVLLLLSGSIHAQGDLLIFPKRLIFEGDQRGSETVNLSNNGNDSATYMISFVEIRMNEDGNFENITEPDSGQKFASPYLRFFPRKVALGPRESQLVKIQLTRTNQLEAGEYRSHLYFRAVPKLNMRQKEDKAPENVGKSIVLQLTPVYGITIPVIIRKGEGNTRVKMDNLRLSNYNGIPVLDLDLYRSGNMSAYGNIEVKHISPNGKQSLVAEIQGLGIYTPGTLRKTRIDLNKSQDVDLSQGKLKVVFYEESPVDGRKTLAEGELSLP